MVAPPTGFLPCCHGVNPSHDHMEGGPVTCPGCFVDIIISVNDQKGVEKQLQWKGVFSFTVRPRPLPQCVTPGLSVLWLLWHPAKARSVLCWIAAQRDV